ncbi:MAG TPA: protein kinase [Streptosporangiaceae bacterium]|nr:protein kinase [Streptosporangiaceae bacterium]
MSRKIAGYRLGERLGQGRTAAVYLARDEGLHYQVAVKVLAPDPTRDTAFADTFVRESRAAAALDHPHIIPVFDAGQEDGTPYVVMRYARGGDARSLLRRSGALPLNYAWRVIAQVASALDAAHAQGLVHRDVKPANILFDTAGTIAARRPGPSGDRAPDHVYLSDFGMGRVFPPGLVTAADQIADTLDYLAPEQIEGDVLDGRADLYALACTSFELLCGAPPFGAEQGLTLMYAQLYAPPPVAAARRAGLPAAVDAVLARALAKEPADRYPSCGRFAAELRAALGLGSVLRAGPAPSREQVPASPDRAAQRVPASVAGPSLLIAPRPREFTPPAPVAADLPAGTADWPGGAAGPPGEPSPAAGPPASPPPARRWLRPALAAVAVVVVIAAVAAGLVLSKRPASGHSAAGATAASPRTPPTASASASPSAASSSPAPSQASQQAVALDILLASSADARTALHQAVKQVGSCANLGGAASQLQNVVNQRTSEYRRASALTVSALPDGATVKSALITALSRSLSADQDYLTWARQQEAGGCTPSSQSATYNAAFSTSQQADAAKAAFVQVWNPVAARYGLAKSSPRDI